MKNVIITGISGGIGRAVAQELLASGVTVIGTCRNISGETESFAKSCSGRLILYENDLLNVEKLGAFVKSLASKHGPIGGFVHCAGFDKMAPLHMTKIEDIESLWRLHVLVPMVMIAAISKKGNYDRGASIVLISSQSAHEGAMGHTAYAAAKGALEGYLAPAAAELMEKGIRINEVCLAPVKTPMSCGWMDKLTEDGMRRLMESYPLGLGEAEDAGSLICFLLSGKARWINGQIITADGGHSVRKV